MQSGASHSLHLRLPEDGWIHHRSSFSHIHHLLQVSLISPFFITPLLSLYVLTFTLCPCVTQLALHAKHLLLLILFLFIPYPPSLLSHENMVLLLRLLIFHVFSMIRRSLFCTVHRPLPLSLQRVRTCHYF